MDPGTSEDVPVLIVGGSLVGLSAALFLRWHGIDVLAVERHAGTAINARAGHFHLRTVEILRSAGLGMMTTEEYAYARARARRPVKVTLPSPLMLFLVWSPQRSRDAYGDPFELFADGLRLMKEEAEELARMGCRYIQVDAPDFGQLVDQGQREAWERAGISVDRVLSEGADMLNELATVPGVTFGLHLCRGNYDSDWISSGAYEAISKQLFQRAANYDVFLLEYDDERSGSFAALSDVPGDKVVVLGLVSSKFDRMEPPDQLAARIDEAGRFFPRDQLALSTQCGFASAGPGNAISEGAQENKLRLVAEVAARVWPAATTGR
jgi:methionine synthase II (cobalamin-independent)